MRRIYTNYQLFILVTVAVAFISGCATVGQLTKSDNTVDISRESLVLIRIVTFNSISENFVPAITDITFKDINSGESHRLKLNRNARVIDSMNRCDHWIAAFLKPGDYNLTSVRGFAGSFPLRSEFRFPIDHEIKLEPQTITYLGSIRMLNRRIESGSDEPLAGPVLPLISQAASGFSRGTFDITYLETHLEDIEAFKSFYPALRNYEIIDGTKQ